MVIRALRLFRKYAVDWPSLISCALVAGGLMKLSSILRVGVIAAVMSFQAPAVIAAPTCQDRDGLTIRCGTQGAMPVGWSLPFHERKVVSPHPTPEQLFNLIAILGLLFALIALL